jgi:hypothetical protein
VPDLNDLDHFDEGLPVNPLPASEVRRRGDRMRRRNTVLATVGGVAAAAVFIGVPVGIAANHDGGDGVQPAPPGPTSSSPSVEVDWMHEIPADFPLTFGFPETNADDGSATEVTETSGVAQVGLCSVFDWQMSVASDLKGISYRGETEDRIGRSIAVFQDEETAQSGLSAIEVSLCNETDDGSLPPGLKLESQPVEVDLGTEDSYAFFERIRAKDGSLSDLRVVLVARTGNALYVTASLGAAAGDQNVDFEANRLKVASAPSLEAMCLFSAEPCEITSTQATEPAPDPSSSAPPSDALADFPLDLGYPETNGGDGSPVEVTGTPGLGTVELCGAVAWDPANDTTDVIGVQYSGEAEDFRGRTLAVYESEAQATDALDAATSAVEDCPEEPSQDESGGANVYDPVDVDLGDQAVVWTLRYRTPDDRMDTGLTVYHLVRVGNAVYASYEYGEGGSTDESIANAVDRSTDQARPIVEAMRDL